MPAILLGLAVIRGEPVPVLDLAAFLQGPNTGSPTRFVLVRAGTRQVAIAVEAVQGVVRMQRSLQQDLPPLLGEATADLVTAVSVRDQQLLLMLQAARLVPEEVWRELDSREKAS